MKKLRWLLIALLLLSGATVAKAGGSDYTRTATAQFHYVSVYKNRLLNAQAAINQLQQFFNTVKWEPYHHYSFIRDVLHNDLKAADGYVNTPLGYGFGACGASSLLNKLIKTTTFRDSNGQEQNLFQTVLVWTWHGDKTYGQYGATIYLDLTGKHTRDYIWQINPNYNGSMPIFTTHFDIQAQNVELTVKYSDNSG